MLARLLLVAAVALLALGPAEGRAQVGGPPHESPPVLKVDLIVPAGLSDEGTAVTDLCVDLSAEATTITVSRRPFVSEAGSDRPLYMSIRPYVSTALPLVERAMLTGDMSMTIPELGAETCFSFENQVGRREVEAHGMPQPYKYFAQVVHLEVR